MRSGCTCASCTVCVNCAGRCSVRVARDGRTLHRRYRSGEADLPSRMSDATIRGPRYRGCGVHVNAVGASALVVAHGADGELVTARLCAKRSHRERAGSVCVDSARLIVSVVGRVVWRGHAWSSRRAWPRGDSKVNWTKRLPTETHVRGHWFGGAGRFP